MCKTSPRSALKVLAILTPICCNEPWNFPKYFLDGHLHFLRTIIRKNRKIHWKSSPQTVPNPSISNDNLITTKERKEKSSFPRLHNIWMTLKSSRKRKKKSEYFPWMQKKQREKWIEKKKKDKEMKSTCCVCCSCIFIPWPDSRVQPTKAKLF